MGGELDVNDVLQKNIPNETLKELDNLREAIKRFRVDRDYKVDLKTTGNTVRFGVVSDLHAGSLYERFDALSAFYDKLRSENIKLVLMPGDILDGHGIYKGQVFEQYAHGLDKQIETLKKNHPSTEGMRVIFITGNHDNSFYKLTGTDPGPIIAAAMSWECAGRDVAHVELETEDKYKLTVGLYHPRGGTAYAISWKTQKIIESIPGGKKPNIALIGHYHKMDALPRYRNVYGVQPGTFQGQTPFMASVPTDAHVGGCIVEVVLGNKKHLTSSVKIEFVSFYEPEDK